MILRKLADAIREQNWFTVVLEILIVVVGIFIGLQVDDWNEARKNQAKEYARLVGLHENVVTTLEDLREEREAISGAVEALRHLITLNEREESDSQVLEHFRYAFLYGASFTPELNVYDDLMSSGELALLTSAKLRQGLAKMDSRLTIAALAQADLSTVQQLNIDPYLVDRANLRQIIGDLVGLDEYAGGSEIDRELITALATQNRLLMKLDIVIQLEKTLENAEQALEEVRELIEKQQGAPHSASATS